MNPSEASLITRIRGRDPEALAEYVQRHSAQLLGFIEKRMSVALRRKVEPADILQEVSTSVLLALKDVDLTERDPFSWLCQQAERRIIDAHRHHIGAQKRSAEREVSLHSARDEGAGDLGDLIVASLTSPSQAFTNRQREYHVWEALKELPEETREAVRLKYVEGWESREIADRLGKNEGAVRVMLSRAMGKLQSLLAANTDFQTLMARVRRPRNDLGS